MLKSDSILIKNINNSIKAKSKLLKNKKIIGVFSQSAKIVLNSYKLGGKLLIAGNGGSAADAQHLAAEFVCRLTKDRSSLPAEALTTDTSVLTAIANDYGYKKIFSRQLESKAKTNDIFLGITTSGNSENILEAVKKCKDLRIPSIIFTGYKGGKVSKIADYAIVVPGGSTMIIQELHIVLAHSLCEFIELNLT
jgi:D-sedoheptulose 7-phosphate isomerase